MFPSAPGTSSSLSLPEVSGTGRNQEAAVLVPPLCNWGTQSSHPCKNLEPTGNIGSTFCSLFLKLVLHISGEKGKLPTTPQAFGETCLLGGKGRGRQGVQAAAPTWWASKSHRQWWPLFFLFFLRTQRSYWFLWYSGEGMAPNKTPPAQFSRFSIW